MKVHIVNRILLLIEVIPVSFLLLLALSLLGDNRPIFFGMLALSILSMIALIYMLVMTGLNKPSEIESRFIYLAHAGVFLTVIGLVFIWAGSDLKSHSPNASYGFFSFGVIAFIPYLHVMLINNFFRPVLRNCIRKDLNN